MSPQTKFRATDSENSRSLNVSENQMACPSRNNEYSRFEDRIIVGAIPMCLHHDCRGWIVDSFAGKYWIRCQDPKHRGMDVDVGIGISKDSYTDDNDDECKKTRSTSPSLPHKSDKPTSRR